MARRKSTKARKADDEQDRLDEEAKARKADDEEAPSPEEEAKADDVAPEEEAPAEEAVEPTPEEKLPLPLGAEFLLGLIGVLAEQVPLIEQPKVQALGQKFLDAATKLGPELYPDLDWPAVQDQVETEAEEQATGEDLDGDGEEDDAGQVEDAAAGEGDEEKFGGPGADAGQAAAVELGDEADDEDLDEDERAAALDRYGARGGDVPVTKGRCKQAHVRAIKEAGEFLGEHAEEGNLTRAQKAAVKFHAKALESTAGALGGYTTPDGEPDGDEKGLDLEAVNAALKPVSERFEALARQLYRTTGKRL